MLLLKHPEMAMVKQRAAAYREAPFSYEPRGGTREGRGGPPGFFFDHNRIQVGSGKDAYERAKREIRAWTMFANGWTKVWPEGLTQEVGSVIGVVIPVLMFWSVNFSRVLYAMNDEPEASGDVVRFGFAYGTLFDHLESGEERFSVEWNKRDDSVWYDLLAFSRPQHPLVKLGLPYARYKQRCFVLDSLAAMKRGAAK